MENGLVRQAILVVSFRDPNKYLGEDITVSLGVFIHIIMCVHVVHMHHNNNYCSVSISQNYGHLVDDANFALGWLCSCLRGTILHHHSITR